MIIVTAKQKSFCVGWLRIIQMMKADATNPRPTKNQRCQPEAPARNENAAPVLCTRTRLKKLHTGWVSPSLKVPMISVLVIWSSRITSTAKASHSARLGPEEGLDLVTMSGAPGGGGQPWRPPGGQRTP